MSKRPRDKKNTNDDNNAKKNINTKTTKFAEWLVGNRYCNTRPCDDLDKTIRLVPENGNVHDKNAVKVVTTRGNNEYRLGYIPKKRAMYFRENLLNISVCKIEKQENTTKYPYYRMLCMLKSDTQCMR